MLTVEIKAKFQETVTEISKHLSLTPDFTGMDYRKFAVLKDPGKVVELYLHEIEYGANKGRLEISGRFPHSAKGECARPRDGKYSITVSPKKTAKQVAEEIKRRLYPSYLTAVKETWQMLQSWQAYEIKRSETIQKVAASLGASVDDRSGLVNVKRDDIVGLNSYIETYSDDKVKFSLVLTADQAIKVLALLKVEA